MKIIAVVSGKDGVGKTTLCANLSVALRSQGHQVLSVDMDPQNGLGLHFGLAADHINGISRATLSSADWRAAMYQSERGDSILPFGLIDDTDRAIFEKKLADEPGLLLAQLQLLKLPEDSFVLLDTPTGTSVYQQQAFAACHALALVLCPDATCYTMATKYIKKIETQCNSRTDFMGHMIVINQVDRSRKINSDITDFMRESMDSAYFSIIHQDQSIPEAVAWGQAVIDYDPACRATRDISHIVEILGLLMANAVVTH